MHSISEIIACCEKTPRSLPDQFEIEVDLDQFHMNLLPGEKIVIQKKAERLADLMESLGYDVSSVIVRQAGDPAVPYLRAIWRFRREKPDPHPPTSSHE